MTVDTDSRETAHEDVARRFQAHEDRTRHPDEVFPEVLPLLGKVLFRGGGSSGEWMNAEATLTTEEWR